MTQGQSGGTIAQERLDYQHIVGALLAIGLIDDPTFVALHCETLDDLLLESTSNRYVCVQVTSKETGLDPLRARDPKVLKTFATFCAIERHNGSTIDRYSFISSAGFHSGKPPDQCLQTVIDTARSIAVSAYATDTTVGKFHKGIAKLVDAKYLPFLESVFAKIELTDHPPLRGARTALHSAIGKTLEDQLLPTKCINNIQDALERAVHDAATATVNLSNLTYIAVAQGKTTLSATILAAKILSKPRIKEIIEKAKAQFSEAVIASGSASDGFPNIRRKLSTNGAADPTIFAVQSAAYHAEYQQRARQISESPTIADGFKHKLRSVAARLYKDAYDDLAAGSEAPAQDMYTELASRIPGTIRSNRIDLPLLDVDELLGTIGLQTEECHHWWGPRPSVESTS